MKTYIKLFVILLALSPAPALAQDAVYLEYLEQITKINSYSPEQSPRHEKGAEILSDRIIDSKNRVVGEINNVIFNGKGEITALDVEFDRLKRGKDRIIIDYAALQVESAGNGYKTGFNEDQLKEMFPDLLKTSTKFRRQEGLVSLKSLKDALIVRSNDKRLGNVREVLFDAEGSKADFLYVEVNYGSLRGEALAIPFDTVSYRRDGSKIIVRVNDKLADAMTEYTKK